MVASSIVIISITNGFSSSRDLIAIIPMEGAPFKVNDGIKVAVLGY
jgi:hypothetical protein